jgi:hypothetical protein
MNRACTRQLLGIQCTASAIGHAYWNSCSIQGGPQILHHVLYIIKSGERVNIAGKTRCIYAFGSGLLDGLDTTKLK